MFTIQCDECTYSVENLCDPRWKLNGDPGCVGCERNDKEKGCLCMLNIGLAKHGECPDFVRKENNNE